MQEGNYGGVSDGVVQGGKHERQLRQKMAGATLPPLHVFRVDVRLGVQQQAAGVRVPVQRRPVQRSVLAGAG